MEKLDAPLGIAVVGVVLMIGCRLVWWPPGMVIGAALILGVLAATYRRRRSGPDPEETIRPGGDGRPWRRPRS